jgi:hypothetical protein
MHIPIEYRCNADKTPTKYTCPCSFCQPRRPNLPSERDKAHEAPDSHRQSHDMPQIHPRRNIKCVFIQPDRNPASRRHSTPKSTLGKVLRRLSRCTDRCPSSCQVLEILSNQISPGTRNEAWILLETSMVFQITAEMSALLLKLAGDATEIEFTMHVCRATKVVAR